MEVPKGIYLRIAARSSLALRGMCIEGGVIDNDYRGEIIFLMRNTTSKKIKIKETQRVAQAIFEQAKTPCLILTDKLTQTTRAAGSFGSTGNYNKIHKEEAIACALQAAMESHTQAMVNSLHNDEDDRYSEFMQSDNQQQSLEGKNKPYPSSYAVVTPTDLIMEYLDDIETLLKGKE